MSDLERSKSSAEDSIVSPGSAAKSIKCGCNLREFDLLLDDLIENKSKFDMNRMANLIKMKISDINDKFKDKPHQTVSKVCIGDFLYGSLENQREFK